MLRVSTDNFFNALARAVPSNVFLHRHRLQIHFATQHTHQESGDAGDRREENSEGNQVEVNGLL